MHSGTVKWFSSAKGYGFIEPEDGGKDVFVHIRNLPPGVETLAEGQKIEFELGKGRDGRTHAENIVLP